jgi:hypothetical protein
LGGETYAVANRQSSAPPGGGSRIRHSWYVDETYIKVSGRWCYLYRAIDRIGALVDVMLSETRDMSAAEKFFRSAKADISADVVPAASRPPPSFGGIERHSEAGIRSSHRGSNERVILV